MEQETKRKKNWIAGSSLGLTLLGLSALDRTAGTLGLALPAFEALFHVVFGRACGEASTTPHAEVAHFKTCKNHAHHNKSKKHAPVKKEFLVQLFLGVHWRLLPKNFPGGNSQEHFLGQEIPRNQSHFSLPERILW